MRRIPFTLSMLTALCLVALVTETHVGHIPRDLLARFGFAPRHLWTPAWTRLITSALLTHGEWYFLRALLMTALALGACEAIHGTIRAALAFWGIHFAALLVTSLLVTLPLHLLGAQIGSLLVVANDVGPSAGYMGCLGLVLASLPPPWRRSAIALVTAVLLLSLARHLLNGSEPAAISADLAHLAAFPLGLAACVLTKRPREPILPAEVSE